MAYLVANRKKFTLPADGAVEIRVELTGDLTPKPRVWLQCNPCGDELQETQRSMFECPECGYELTSQEAGLLARRHMDALRSRFDLPDLEPKKGLLWRFLGLFVNRKRLPAPKS
jgi:hypothetical protein